MIREPQVDVDVWVWKHDGSVQCQSDPETTLAQDRELLARHIGAENILAEEKRGVVVPRMCGLPTGRVNAYKLTKLGYEVLMRGIVGPLGFEVWPDGPIAAETAEAQSPQIFLADIIQTTGLNSAGENPVLLREVIGRPVRVYTVGDAITKDYRPKRVNLELDARGLVSRVWFG